MDSRSTYSQKKNEGFIIRVWGKFYLRDTAGSPEQEKFIASAIMHALVAKYDSIHLASSQS